MLCGVQVRKRAAPGSSLLISAKDGCDGVFQVVLAGVELQNGSPVPPSLSNTGGIASSPFGNAPLSRSDAGAPPPAFAGANRISELAGTPRGAPLAAGADSLAMFSMLVQNGGMTPQQAQKVVGQVFSQRGAQPAAMLGSCPARGRAGAAASGSELGRLQRVGERLERLRAGRARARLVGEHEGAHRWR